ncbi:MAG: RNA-binding protein [Cellvibrionaceae bacterium]|jgi:RNA-binding protein
MSFTNEQKKHYRSIGHGLNPVVTISSNGLSKTVMAELDRALTDHELIKIKLALDDKDARKKLTKRICDHTSSHVVQEIGKVALILRTAKKPNPKLSNLLR